MVHLLSYVVKCTVTDQPFSTQANWSKCPPSAWMHFLTRVTREPAAMCSRYLKNSLTPEPFRIGRMCIRRFRLRISSGIKPRSSDLNSWDTCI